MFFEFADAHLAVLRYGEGSSECGHIVVGEHESCGELHPWRYEHEWSISAEVILYLFAYPEGLLAVEASHVSNGVLGLGYLKVRLERRDLGFKPIPFDIY